MTAMPANPTPAEGVVVPIYPTEAMLDAAHEVPVMTFEGEPVYTTSREAEAIYLAMLAARPAAPTQSAAQTGEEAATLIEAQAAEIEGLRKAVEEAVTAAMWSEKALERYDNALGLDVDEAALIALSKCKDFVERYDTHPTTQEGPNP